MQSKDCNSVSEQLMARKSAKTGTHSASTGSRVLSSRTWPRSSQSPVRRNVDRRRVLCWRTKLVSAAWTWKARRPSRGVSPTRKLKRDVWRRSMNKKEGCCSLLRRWVWSLFTAELFFIALSSVGEADTINPVCATAKLYDTQFDEIGLWASNLTNKSVKELTPLFAQVAACRQWFCEEFEKESFPYRSSVSQDIPDTHRHAGIPFLLVSPKHAVRTPHTQPSGDYLSLFHDGGQNSSIGCGQPQMNFRDLCGWERSNPFCHHTARGGRK